MSTHLTKRVVRVGAAIPSGMSGSAYKTALKTQMLAKEAERLVEWHSQLACAHMERWTESLQPDSDPAMNDDNLQMVDKRIYDLTYSVVSATIFRRLVRSIGKGHHIEEILDNQILSSALELSQNQSTRDRYLTMTQRVEYAVRADLVLLIRSILEGRFRPYASKGVSHDGD